MHMLGEKAVITDDATKTDTVDFTYKCETGDFGDLIQKWCKLRQRASNGVTSFLH